MVTVAALDPLDAVIEPGDAEIVEVVAEGAPATNETAPPETETGEVIERVLLSAWVELRVQIETPLEFVELHEP